MTREQPWSGYDIFQWSLKGKPSLRSLFAALLWTLAILLVAASLLILLWPTSLSGDHQPEIVGNAFFISSGLLDTGSDQGIMDQLQIRLQQIPPPATGHRYYAWLLDDKGSNALLLDALQTSDGRASLTYKGNAQHQDLLAIYSKLVITEDVVSPVPTHLSTDKTVWRYASELSAVPNPADTINHYSLLAHLRHLLAQDPKLQNLGLTGGLDIWLYRNTLKILEWSGSARDAYQGHDVGLMQRQLARIQAYLMGQKFLPEENLSATLSSLLANAPGSRVGILSVQPNASPPAYLDHILNHLLELTSSPSATDQQRQLAKEIQTAVKTAREHFLAVYEKIHTILHLAPEQLADAGTSALLNTIFTEANAALVGNIDPTTNQATGGVAQIHYLVQSLATMSVQACRGTGSCL
ncbi:hypothetical protein [Tengunoibacter tsumagoiensis]|uniref:Uncharacterized protein n=1 Tax=Tengunoibacter tsumagoiensis TaxID=2014871 RepID=A0A401ZX45_9CHLR|nr:hypothetical protein [Tengunoibacter tsumagoiensis]GCE11364.1 hypothetical protein KTT_12230 [Tengunoibacter tsumagoiensis]